MDASPRTVRDASKTSSSGVCCSDGPLAGLAEPPSAAGRVFFCPSTRSACNNAPPSNPPPAPTSPAAARSREPGFRLDAARTSSTHRTAAATAARSAGARRGDAAEEESRAAARGTTRRASPFPPRASSGSSSERGDTECCVHVVFSEGAPERPRTSPNVVSAFAASRASFASAADAAARYAMVLLPASRKSRASASVAALTAPRRAFACAANQTAAWRRFASRTLAGSAFAGGEYKNARDGSKPPRGDPVSSSRESKIKRALARNASRTAAASIASSVT